MSATFNSCATLVLPREHERAGLFFIAAQVVWWGMGVSLVYDVAEFIFHLPHFIVVGLYAGMMIASTWFGRRAMAAISFFTMPALCSIFYFSATQALPGSSAWALWSQMSSLKFLEYSSWLLLVLGSFARLSAMRAPGYTALKFHLSTALAVLGFIVGTGLMIYSGIHAALENHQKDLLLLLAQQGSNIIWVLGLTSKSCRPQQEKNVFNSPSSRILWLVVGVISCVGYDWLSQFIVGWWQYPSVFLPPLAMLLIWK